MEQEQLHLEEKVKLKEASRWIEGWLKLALASVLLASGTMVYSYLSLTINISIPLTHIGGKRLTSPLS